MKGLFIVGNKRSGSTHTMRLLNLHPEVFVSNESDIIWILYNFHNNREISEYMYDSPSGMHSALEKAESVLDKNATVLENFTNFQRYLMENGFLKVKPIFKEKLSYIGDQKPYQNIDPEMIPFILEHFPEAKFIHILRHPFEVLESSRKFGNGTGGDIWKGMGPKELMEKWELHESWVRDAKEKYELDLFELKYDQLISDPKKKMAEVFDFLKLSYDGELLKKCQMSTYPNFKPINEYPVTPSQEKMMKSYGMKSTFSKFESQVYRQMFNYYLRFKRKFF